MGLSRNAAVLVADGRKLLFLGNDGDDTIPASSSNAPPGTLGEPRGH